MRRRDFFGIGAIAPVKAAQEVAKPEYPDKGSIDYKVKSYLSAIRRKIEDPRWIETQRVRGMPEGFEKETPHRVGLCRSARGDIDVLVHFKTPPKFHGFCIATIHTNPTDGFEYRSYRSLLRGNDDAIARLIAQELGAKFVSVTRIDTV